MSTENITPRQSFLTKPQNIILTIAAIVISWMLFQDILPLLIMVVILVLFIIGLSRPIWALAGLMVSQLTISTFMISTPLVDISLRLLLLVVTFLIIGKSLINKEVSLGPDTRRIIIPIIILSVLNIISNIVNSADFDFVFRDFRHYLVGLMFVIVLPAIIENNRQLKMISIVTLIVILASSVIGLFQHYNILGMSQATLFEGFMAATYRVPGMGETELELAYILPMTIMILFGLYLTKAFSRENNKYIFLTMVIMLLALYFTYTRSSLIAIPIAVIAIFLFIWKKINWNIILVLSFILILLINVTGFLGNTYLLGRSEGGQENSSVARDILWQASIAMAMDHPILGIGGNRFIELSPEYVSAVDPDLIAWEEDRYYQYRTLGTNAPHNDFIKTWAYYGTFALIIYIWLHFAIIRNCANSFRDSKRRFLKGLSLGIAAALITYVINSFYHNVYATIPIFWILIGFSLAVNKLTAREKVL